MKTLKKISTIIITISVILGIVSLGNTEEITDYSTKQKFATVLRIKGFTCDKCSKAYFVKKTYKGLVFRVICNDFQYMYRVLVTNSGSYIISPW